MILVNNVNLPLDTNFNELTKELCKLPKLKKVKPTSAKLYKKSVDARKRDDVHFCCSVLINVSTDEKKALSLIKDSKIHTEKEYVFKKATATSGRKPLIVGFGPAGIFAAYTLVKAGLNPIVIERGEDVDTRTERVRSFWNGGSLNTESNVQFGEGGAGTFSDGKLTTGISDERCRTVLSLFCEYGADKGILTDAKPHIGTDVLSGVIKNLRNEITALGGEIRFSHKLQKINIENGHVVSAEVVTKDECYTIECDNIILATGHSARDTFEMLRDLGIEMVRKPFAVGVRIEHRQEDINLALYGDFRNHPALKAADYKAAVHLPDGRGVYTFCMCPGGVVVNASSEKGRTAVNGMSYAARNGENANSAVLTEIKPDDLDGDDVLAGMALQRSIEEAAYRLTDGNGVPTETVGEYVFGKSTIPTVSPTVKPKAVFTDIATIFPDFVNRSLRAGICELGKKICNFDNPGAVLTAPESRSSSPVRILRTPEFCSVSAKGLFPCGEGAGYAGGIMSAAVDGIKCAEAVISNIHQCLQGDKNG